MRGRPKVAPAAGEALAMVTSKSGLEDGVMGPSGLGEHCWAPTTGLMPFLQQTVYQLQNYAGKKGRDPWLPEAHSLVS